MEKLVDLFTHHAVLPEFWMWVIFGVAVLVLLLWDLLFFNRKNEVPNFMHTLVVCIVYILAACVFGVFVMYEEGFDKGMLFFTGFLVEKSLSLDNVFIMSLIFTTLGVPRMYQHRVLFWGILGAIVMRAVLILVGDALIRQFHWVLYVFSAFLLYTGVKMILPAKEEAKSLKDSRLYKLVSKMFHVTHEIHGAHFFNLPANNSNCNCIWYLVHTELKTLLWNHALMLWSQYRKLELVLLRHIRHVL